MDFSRNHDSSQRLHHLGFVVADIAGSMEGSIRSLAARRGGRVFEDPHQKVKVAFLTVRPGDPLGELVEPAPENSPVRRFLSERGGGLHHLCYMDDDLEGHITEMKARRSVLIPSPKPAVAFDGKRIAWMLTAEKLLVELLEKGQPQLK